MKTTIYHNSRCGKSRCALEILNEKKEAIEVIEYLKNPISETDLTKIIKLLGIKPIELVRKGEEVFKQNYKDKQLSDNEWIKAMVENPILIERPIIVKNNKAVIGRPPEKVLEIL